MDNFNKPEVKNSMVEIFVNFLSFILLGIIATSIGFLYFQVINKYFPDILSGTYQNYRLSNYSPSLIRYSIASLIIGSPIYLWAIWFWFKSFKVSPEKTESRLSKWLTYIVLLIASGTIIGDLITIVYNFLQGEYGARFLFKALTILVIAGLVFSFYFFERKRIQYKKEIFSGFFRFIGIFAGLLVTVAIVLGFIVGGTPFEARLRNFDLKRINDLQVISSAVSNFAFENSRLPKNLNEIRNNPRYNYGASYTDPETQKEYDYKIVKPVEAGINDSLEYELCATFSTSGLNEPESGEPYGYVNWARHDKGYVCQKQNATLGTKNIKETPGIPVPAR